ncbi:hypothetical protein [Megasphaera stantonii]|uniref:hypothetical protein n=1 Tax=Megasphaera stantonii TaxID=2144175 RepID=UPI001958B5C0|nr:hypothetical protein [Megasphaera stantonii]MBM6733556.1 hypothetical protein [Megasphaera stantonii]
MSSREIAFSVGLVIMIYHIVKAYILKVRLTPKDKILLTYAPKRIFFLVNVVFVFSLLNMFYVIFMNPSIENTKTGPIFVWLSCSFFGTLHVLLEEEGT